MTFAGSEGNREGPKIPAGIYWVHLKRHFSFSGLTLQNPHNPLLLLRYQLFNFIQLFIPSIVAE